MQPNTASPRDQNNIDPAISGSAILGAPPQTPPQPEPAPQESPKTYGKRPLSTSKRAAQNRAAQVCFFFFFFFAPTRQTRSIANSSREPFVSGKKATSAN